MFPAGADPGFAKGGDHDERAEREPITGVLRPQCGPVAEPLVVGQGAKSPEAESFLALERPTKP